MLRTVVAVVVPVVLFAILVVVVFDPINPGGKGETKAPGSSKVAPPSGTLMLEIEPIGVPKDIQVTFDGQVIERLPFLREPLEMQMELDCGKHEVVVNAPNYQTERQSFTVKQGEEKVKVVEVKFMPCLAVTTYVEALRQMEEEITVWDPNKASDGSGLVLTPDSLRAALFDFYETNENSRFSIKAATVADSDLPGSFHWRNVCSSNTNIDHLLLCGHESNLNAFSFLSCGVARLKGQLRPGLIMHSYPPGNILTAEWEVSIPRKALLMIQWALTDKAVKRTRNGLRFQIITVDHLGKKLSLLESRLKKGDDQIYEKTWQIAPNTTKIRFVHDNLGDAFGDVLWFYPKIMNSRFPGAADSREKESEAMNGRGD